MTDTIIKQLFEAGAHYGYSRTRRNPTMAPYIFGQKNRNDIFDLELTAKKLDEAEKFITEIASNGKQILFVGGKNEAHTIMREAAEKVGAPFVCGRWIGGTLTNFKEISKRVRRLEKLRDDKEKGNLEKYTKKERLLMDREIEDLEATFGGIVSMKELPKAIFIVDPRFEEIAVNEAHIVGVPIVALSNSDCDLLKIKYPIPANDATNKSITFFVDKMVEAIEAGKKLASIASPSSTKKNSEEK